MSTKILLGSVILGLVFTGLSQLSDPGLLGIQEEPGRIMFYGGTGLLAGFFGLTALLGGIYIGARRFGPSSDHRRRLTQALVVIGCMVALAILVVRFFPPL